MGINSDNVLRLLKQKQETRGERIARLVAEKRAQQGGTATVVSSVEENNDRFFKAGAFSDGYQFGDVIKTILGTTGDIGVNAVKGAGSLVEGVTDLLGYAGAGVADLVGADEFASDWKKSIQKNTVDALLKGMEDRVDKASVLGGRSDAISQGLGQVAAIILTGGAGSAAGLGSTGVTALTTGVTGLSGMGSGMSQAYQEGATDGEAVTYGAISGTAEALTEWIFAGMGKSVKALGLSKGLSSADDILAKKLSSKISSQLGKNLVQLGVKASAEGTEEVLSGIAQAFGKKLTYMSEEDLGKIVKDERLFDQFLTGAITSGIAQSGIVPGMKAGSFREANQTGRDLITGLTQNEQAVVDKEFADRVAERQKSGELSKKQEAEIYDKVLEDMEQGRISTDIIESVLGGDTYKGYQDALAQESKLKKEIEELESLADNAITVKQRERLTEARKQLEGLDTKTAKSNLFAEVDKLTAKDTKLRESYNERTRRGQAFTADLSKYDAKQQETVKRAIESGILNNSNRTHEFVDLIAKISANKGVSFNFADNAKLKESGFAIDGKQVNGFVTADGVTININSAKALNSVVGHEITHVLEGTELYAELQSAITEYAKSKGDYQGRYDTLTELYKDIEGADIDAELTADLVGDYLFTDADFVQRLSTEHRGVFQKLYDEIKHLCKLATAGTKEARELEKVKKLFEDAYRTETKNPTADSGVRYALESKTQQGKLDPRTVTKDDVLALLRQVEDGSISGNTYIPLRIGTPQILIYWADKRNGDTIDNNPIAISADKAQNAMNRNGETRENGGRPNRLTADEIVAMVENMNDPEYIVYQGGNDRYVEVVKFNRDNGDSAFAVLEIGNNKDAVYMNGYEGGLYNILVTTYPPITGKLKELLNGSQNKVIYDKKKDASQRTSSSTVPSVLNDASFYKDIISEPSVGVKEEKAPNAETRDVFGFAVNKDANVNEDLLEELSIHDPNAEVDADGNVTVYHRTTAENADSIRRTGIMKAQEDALFFSSKDSGYASDYGDTVVKLKIPSTVLQVNDIFDGEVHFDIPLKYKNGGFQLDVRKYLQETKEPSKTYSLSGNEQSTVPAGGYRITGEDIALAPTKEDIAQMEQEIATAQTAPRNDTEELGAPTREDIARMDRDKKLKGPLLMKDSLDRELEKLYRLQQLNQIQDNAYFMELFKVNAAYQAAGRDFTEAFKRVVGAYQGEVETQPTVAGEDSTAVNTDPAQHTPQEQAIIEEYQAAVDEELVNYVEKVKANPGAKNGRYTLKNVSDRAAADIKKLTGVDVAGNKTQIEGRIVEHILKRHGENGKADHSMRDVNDIARIQYVLDNYDSITVGEKTNGYRNLNADGKLVPAQTVILSKKVNGTYYVVEAVPESKAKALFITSAYMSKNGQKESAAAPLVGDAEAYRVTSETKSKSTAAQAGTNVPANTVPQNFDDVKQEEVEAVLGEKGAYVSKQANALYDEVKSMQKGKRVSNTLSYLLDTLDLSEEHKAESYNSLRTALLNIRDNPNQVVNPNSSVEAAAREMLGREYDAMAEDYANAEGVAKSFYTKMESLRTELENNQRMREESNADFDEEIARLQAVYDGKKDKNTKVANGILRRIERIQRLKTSVDADFGKRIDKIGERLEKMSKPEYRTAMQRKAKMEEYTDLMAKLVGDTSTWVDKKLGISYSINTLRRNLRAIVRDAKGDPDLEKADAIYDELQGKYNHNEAELKRESARIKAVFQKMNLTRAEDTYAHMLGEFQYNPDSKLTQEQVEEYYEKHKKKIDTQKVDNAIAEARKVFDELIVRVNERLKEQGMKQIPYRQGYFPHFTNPKQTWLHKLFNWKPVDNEIPTSIAGLTEEFNPQKSYQSFDKQRTSDATDYSLEQGLDSYIHGALDWIYHIEDIQKRRALENHIRYVHSDEGIKKRIDEIRNNESYDADEAQELIDAVYAEAKNPLNNFVSDLRTGTNTLANKKSSLDRKAEEMTNRKIYSVMTNLNSRINANMVVGSFSSALTNFIPITQSWLEVSPVYSLKGMRDTIKSTIRDDGVVSKSDFLTNRLMNEEKLYQTGWDKVSEKAGIMMEAIDSFTSQTVWRSKYLQNIAEGMSETEAIKNADQFAENVIAGRSRGNQPTIFDAKNPLTKIFTAFQLEVANQYGYMFKDAPQDTKNKGRLIKGYATAFLGAYAYNALYSSLVGRDAAFDPISILEDLFRDLFGDDEEEPEEAFLNLADNVIEEVPFIGGLMGGGRVPISSAIPYEGDYKTFITDIANGELSAKEMLKPIYYLAMPVAGGQIKKTNEGLKMFDEDLPVAGSYTESGNLRFPVEDDSIADWLQAALFGQYASKNAREYFDNGWAPLKEKQIEEFASLDIPIADYREIRKQLGKLGTTGEKLAYIHTLDLPISKKNILANNLTDRKTPIDMADWGKLEEFDYAVKYPEKAQFLVANGISVKEYNNFDDETKDAYDWAYLNPEKFAVSKTVTDDIVTYRTYTKALIEIKADKDSAGKTVSGSRKKKVVQYINGLDAEYGAKLVLYKMEYPSDNTYNGKIIEYVNGIEGFTYEQKATVLKELGFTVTSDGRVRWN